MFLLNERIVKTAVVDESRYQNGADEDQRRNCKRRVILFCQFFGGVPGAPFALGKTAQIHGVADEFNSVEGRKYEGDDDQQGIFKAVGKFCLVRQIQSAGLLGQADITIIALNIREVAQGQRDGKSSLVVHPNPVQGGGEFAGVGGKQKDDSEGNDRRIFEELGNLVENLLPGQAEPGIQAGDLVARAVNRYALFRGEEKGNDGIGDQEDEDIDDHQANLRKLDARKPEDDEGKNHHRQDDANIIREHDGKGQQ